LSPRSHSQSLVSLLCSAWRNCTSTEYEAAPPTVTSDRFCRAFDANPTVTLPSSFTISVPDAVSSNVDIVVFQATSQAYDGQTLSFRLTGQDSAPFVVVSSIATPPGTYNVALQLASSTTRLTGSTYQFSMSVTDSMPVCTQARGRTSGPCEHIQSFTVSVAAMTCPDAQTVVLSRGEVAAAVNISNPTENSILSAVATASGASARLVSSVSPFVFRIGRTTVSDMRCCLFFSSFVSSPRTRGSQSNHASQVTWMRANLQFTNMVANVSCSFIVDVINGVQLTQSFVEQFADANAHGNLLLSRDTGVWVGWVKGRERGRKRERERQRERGRKRERERERKRERERERERERRQIDRQTETYTQRQID
jgi:hypothetical protein